LAETLASVAQQSYPNIEVVLVNAKGALHSPLSYVPAHMQLRMIEPADHAGLGRSAAANLALDQAQGSLALFLDDDDLIAPEHLQRLVQALHDQPRAAGVYSGVQVVGVDGKVIREYDTPWSPHRMAGINFLPIHAVLFRIGTVRERRIRFDTTLPVLEDWDFWHQLTQDHDLLHYPGVSAVYRQGLGQSSLSDPGHANHWKKWHRQLLERYLSSATPDQTAEVLAWHAIELDQLACRLDELILQDRALQQQLAQSQADLRLLDQQTHQHVQARDQLQQELEHYSLQMQAELSAQEAKLQSYAAQSMVALSQKEAQLQEFSEKSQQALSEKEAQLQEFSEKSQQALSEKEAQLQKELLQKLKLQKDLDAIQHSRWWRWGQSVLRIMGRSRT
jgi:hypothetical protein